MNLKIVTKSQADINFDIRKLEEDLTKESIEYEKKLALERLNSISSHYSSETLVLNGIKCKREVSEIMVSIGRVSVKWARPIYVGSKKGKPIRFYPADESIKLPKKTKGSYHLLSNCALLCSFLPFNLAQKILNLLLGIKIDGSTAKRYTETVGQFGTENLEEILQIKKPAIELSEDEILIASIDGSSSLINGSQLKSNKRKKRNRKGKKKIYKR